MKPPRRRFLHLAAGAAALPAASRIARAQTYPARPVRLIVGFPAGSPPDILARLIGQWLSERLGQPFIVEDRPGAGTNIGTEPTKFWNYLPPGGLITHSTDAGNRLLENLISGRTRMGRLATGYRGPVPSRLCGNLHRQVGLSGADLRKTWRDSDSERPLRKASKLGATRTLPPALRQRVPAAVH
jgi:hypothetical protein